MGQFDYKGEKYTDDLNGEIATNPKGIKWAYFGQYKEGVDTKDGIGIMVWEDGATLNY